MSNPPKIDITKSVMSQIETGEVRMKPKAYFMAKKILKFVGLAVIAITLLMAIFYAVVIIQNGVFKEYLEFGNQGANIYWQSLPWGSIVISFLLAAAFALGLYLIEQKKRLVPTLVGTFVALTLVTALVFKVSPGMNNSTLARAVIQVNGNPTKITCVVQEKTIGQLKVKTKEGKIIIVNINNDTLGDTRFEAGDEILVLGYSQNGIVDADAAKLIKKNEKTLTDVKQELPTKVQPETKPIEEQKPETKPTISSPVVSPPTAPSTIPAPGNVITIVSVLPDVSPNPTKYKIKWTSNFPTVTGWKIPYAVGSTPSYPGSSYEYISNPGSTSGTATVLKSTWGSGTFNVRVCAYNTSASVVCGVYSNIFVITF